MENKQTIAKVKEKTINGNKYVVTKFTARKSVHVLWELGRTGIPAFVKAISSMENIKSSNRSIDSDSLTKAFEMLFEKCDHDKIDYIIDELLSLTFVNGQPLLPQLDLIFQGELDVMFKVLAFSFEANYGSFLGAEKIKKMFTGDSQAEVIPLN